MLSKEDLELRRKFIGASDAPIIMGVSPFKNKKKLFEEKVFGCESFSNFAMNRGNELEPLARAEFNRMMNVNTIPFRLFSKKNSWMMASMDGVSLDMRVCVEIKCPGAKDHQSAVNGIIPTKYYPQLQHQMYVCGVDLMYYFSFDGTNGVILECERDNEYIEKMIEEEKKFYDCVINMIYPEDDFIKIESEEWNDLSQEHLKLTSEIKTLSSQIDLIEKRLSFLSQNQNSRGSGLRVEKIFRKGNIDYSQIEELKNIDLEKYRKKSSEYWVFRHEL